jgi:hypothetical protein
VSTPLEETLATPELLDCQVELPLRSSVNPFESVATALSCAV